MLLPPNLAKLGLSRRIQPPIADLITIWNTPYPMLSTYLLLCTKCSELLKPYGGGSYTEQGENWIPGYITSGYRDHRDGGRGNSPHKYALALDIAVGNAELQAKVALVAATLYSRVGLYPNNGIIHVDLVPDNWILRYSSFDKRYWVRSGSESSKQYSYFINIKLATEFAKEN